MKGLWGATLIDGKGGPAISNAVIEIRGQRIKAIGDTGGRSAPDGDWFDVRGKWVIPGLIEAHDHVAVVPTNTWLTGVSDPVELAMLFLRLHTTMGVTTVRGPGNMDTTTVLPLFRTQAKDRPRFYGAGPLLDGSASPPNPFPFQLVLDDARSARKAVASLVDEVGVDFLKVYTSMKPAVLRVVIEEAHRRGVRVTGHVGVTTTVARAVALGIDSLGHVRVGRELVRGTKRASLDALPGRRWDETIGWRPWRYIEPRSAAALHLLDLMAERETILVPTLTMARSVLMGDDPSVRNPIGIESVPPIVRAQWETLTFSSDYNAADFEFARVEFERQALFVALAQQHGVRVAAGTDTMNPWVIPGWSMHVELELLVQAGLTAGQALGAATRVNAELLGKGDEFGTLEQGKIADLVVLNADPLADIRATRSISSVMQVGQLAPRNVSAQNASPVPFPASTVQP